MAIIITKDGKETKKIEKSNFEQEDYLQKFIYENPETIPLYDIKENIQLLVLYREFPTKSGSVDALGIDREGNIYLVETKLYKNPDKRLVVAQVLDYGASLWINYSYDDFINQINSFLNSKLKVNLNQRIGEFFGLSEEEVKVIVEKIHSNLKEGNFKFVVLMDRLHQQLKDLIIYLNANSEFDIYAVELEYYKYNSYEIMIPKIYGSEVKKEIDTSGSAKYKWDWESFSKKLKENFGDDEVQVARAILDWAEQNHMEMSWTTSKRGGFFIHFSSDNGMFYPFNINGDGKIEWNAPHQGDKSPPPFNKMEKRREILERMKSVKGAVVNLYKVDGYSGLNIPLGVLKDKKEQQAFFSVLTWIKQTLEMKS